MKERAGVSSTGRPEDSFRGAETPALCPPGQPLPSLHRIALAIGLLAVGLLAVRQVGSVDVGFHLRTGEYILQGHGWPRTDPFTETMKDHPYTDTSWGYDVMLALVFRAAGAPGLVLLHAAFILGLLTAVFYTARLRPVDPTSLVLILTAAGLSSEMRFEPRPEIVSYLLLAVMVLLLSRRAEGKAAPLFLLAILQVVWANMHSLFVLGWVAMACFFVGGSLEKRRIDWPLARAAGIGILLCVVNPYGLKGVTFPFTLLTRFQEANAFAGTIGEFVSPFALNLNDQFPFYPRLPITLFRILAVLTLLSLWPLLNRKRYSAVLLCLAVAPLAVRMIRNIPLLMMVAAPPLITALSLEKGLVRLRFGEAQRRSISLAVLALMAGAAFVLGLRVFHDAYYIETRRADRFGLGWNRLQLPVDAAEFVRSADLPGSILNHLNFGGFLMWAQPKPVFIDGRLEVAGENFYDEYRAVLQSEAQLENAVERYGIGCIIFPYAINPALLQRLTRDDRWKLIYYDHLSVLFVRADRYPGDRPSGIPDEIEPEIALSDLPGLDGVPRPGPFSRWLRGTLAAEDYPSRDFNIGLFHYFRGELDRAEKRFGSAISRSNGAYYEAYLNLGSVLFRAGRPDLARRAYMVVLSDDPRNRVARERLGDLPAR